MSINSKKIKMIKKITMCIILFNLLAACSSTEKTKFNSHKYTGKEEYFILRGENYSFEKDYLKALNEFSEAYKMNSRNTVTLLGIGYCNFELGNREKAIEYYKKALQVDPKNIVAIKNLSYLYYKKGDSVTAVSYLKMLPPDLKDLFIYKISGYVYLDLKDYNLSDYYLNKAIGEEKNFDSELVYKYATLLRKVNKPNSIYTFLEAYYEDYKNLKEFIVAYSNILNTNNFELEKSEKVLKRYLAIKGKDDEVIIMLAENNIKQGKKNQASEILSMVSPKSKYTEKYLNLKKDIAK
ncbi:MAG: tetratricopeptide repeat protein [Fusobacteriaceae bacterium]